jgi:ribosomal protein S18 acetylase RimI-like enzyme
VDLTFRAADAGDIDNLAAIIQAAYRGDEGRLGWTTEADLLEGQRTDAGELGDVIGDARRRMLVAERDGIAVGCCQVQCDQDGTAYLSMLAVRPGLQDAGVGRAIVTYAEGIAVEECEAERMRMTVLQPRPELISWYERLGYRRTGETEPFPYDHIRWGIPRIPDLAFIVLVKALV